MVSLHNALYRKQNDHSMPGTLAIICQESDEKSHGSLLLHVMDLGVCYAAIWELIAHDRVCVLGHQVRFDEIEWHAEQGSGETLRCDRNE